MAFWDINIRSAKGYSKGKMILVLVVIIVLIILVYLNRQKIRKEFYSIEYFNALDQYDDNSDDDSNFDGVIDYEPIYFETEIDFSLVKNYDKFYPEIVIRPYSKDQFPFNIQFRNLTKSKSPKMSRNMKIVKQQVKILVKYVNKVLNTDILCINQDKVLYPNLFYIQLACGIHDGCPSAFDGPGNLLAHAYYPPYRKLCIDCADVNEHNLKSLFGTLVHEFGHILGLVHVDRSVQKIVGRSIMLSVLQNDVLNFQLFDLCNIQKLYSFLSIPKLKGLESVPQKYSGNKETCQSVVFLL